MDDDIQKKALENLTSLEDLDRSLVVVGIRAWLLLLFFITLIVACVSWAFFSTIPVTVAGKCLVFDPKNLFDIRGPATGVVKETVRVGGQNVKKGDVIVTYENPDFELVAPMDGEIIRTNLKRGSISNPNDIAVVFQGKGDVTDLQIIGFLPLAAGQRVEVGMNVLVALENADPGKYGMIRGKVTDIYPYPVGPTSHYLQLIPSAELLEYLTDHGKVPTILMIAEPLINRNTPSELEWTSETGPPRMIFPGAVGKVQVTLENVKPISYVLPKK